MNNEILWQVLADYFQSNLDYDEAWYSAAIVDAMEALQ